MLGHAEQALRLYQAIGDKASEATALNNVGWTHGLLGDCEQARAFCRQALALCTEVGHHWLEGYVWDSLGYAEHHLGNLGEAAACYQREPSLGFAAGRLTTGRGVRAGVSWMLNSGLSSSPLPETRRRFPSNRP